MASHQNNTNKLALQRGKSEQTKRAGIQPHSALEQRLAQIQEQVTSI